MAEEKKKRGRPKKVAPEISQEVEEQTATPPINQQVPDIQTQVVETIREIFVEKVIEVEKPKLEGYALYKALRAAGFPQGGVGHYIQDPNSADSVYVPHVSEVYTQFLADPQQWEALRDAICREWIKNQG